MFPDFKVGDIVTHGDGDEHCVLWTDSDNGSLPDLIEVVCTRASIDGKCQLGDRERNTVWAFHLVRSAKPHKKFEEPEIIRRRA